MYKRAKEISSGGVVFREQDGKYSVVLAHKEIMGAWLLPKGKMEAGETREQTAVREVKEETGVDAEPIAYLDEIHYTYTDKRRGLTLDKTVYFFLMRYGGGNLRSEDRLIDELRWFDITEAEETAGHTSEKQIISLAREKLAEGAI